MRTSLLDRIKQGSWLSAVKLFTGLIKIKALAIVLGVAGLGVYSLAIQYQMTIAALAAMGMAVIIINKGRPFYIIGEYQRVGEIIGTSIVVLFINNAILFFLFGALFYFLPIIHIPADLGFSSAFSIFLSGTIISASIVLGESVCILTDKYNTYTKINIIVAIIEIPIILFFSKYYYISGALFGILAISILQIIVYFITLSKINEIKVIFKNIKFDIKNISIFYMSSFYLVALAVVPQVAPLIARNLIILYGSAFENGLLQVVTAAEAYFLPFIVAGVTGYLHPIVAETGDCAKAREYLLSALNKTLPMSIIGSLSIVLVVPILIPLVYTHEFSSSEKLFFVYFIFEPFFIFNYIMWMYYMGAQMYKFTLINITSYFLCILLTSIVMTKYIGAEAYVYGHAIGSIITFSLNLFWLQDKSSGKKINIYIPLVLLLSYWTILYIHNESMHINIMNNDIKLSFLLSIVLCIYLYKTIINEQ